MMRSERHRYFRELHGMLDVLSQSVPTLEDLVKSYDIGSVQISAGEGETIMHGLYKDKDVGLARAYLSAGSHIETHRHPAEVEVLKVVEGHMDFQDDKRSLCLDPGGYVCIAPGMRHSAFFPVDTVLIAVSIPCAEGYPDAMERCK